jgi:NADH:ubiquinone reductase (H+-translocating)
LPFDQAYPEERNTMTEVTLPHIIIVGGFGSLAGAFALRKARVPITLVDRSNHHLLQPLLYQVATATLEPGDLRN